MPTHFEGKPEEVLALDTWIKLVRVVDSFTKRVEPGTMGDLTPTQFGAMESLYHLGPMPQCILAEKLLKSSGNITLVIDNLEKRSLVKRVADLQDRRITQVTLTEQGRELIERIFPGHVQAVAREMSVLSPKEQSQLGALCRKLGKTPG
jgi:MarR family transcriptional regulator, 2-MHQ and catechol-resistance regulon repressor